MNRFFLILLSLFINGLYSAFASYNSRLSLYSESSVLKDGTWVRINIKSTGLYKLTYSELKSMGFSDPAKVSVFGYGGKQLSTSLNAETYTDDLPEVPAYRGDGYILFYAQGVDDCSLSNNTYVCSTNAYSNSASYFLTDSYGSCSVVKSENRDYETVDSVTRTTYIGVQSVNPEQVNIASTGTYWYGDAIVKSGSNTYSFDFENLHEGGTAKILFDGVSNASSSYSFELSSGSTTMSQTFTSTSKYENGHMVHMNMPEITQTGNKVEVTVSYDCSSSTAVGYVRWLTVNALCDLDAPAGSWFVVRNYVKSDADGVKYGFSGKASDYVVWSIKDLSNIESLMLESVGDSAFFHTKNNEDVLIFDPKGNDFLSVSSYERVANQNLHDLSGVDMIILTADKFISQAEELADIHRDVDSLSVEVVTQQSVFNEFSSGTPDPTAIRAFMKMLYDRAVNDGTSKPKYLLLFGDGCYDNRGILSSSQQRNLILAYQVDNYSGGYGYVLDDYYGMVADNQSLLMIQNDSVQIAVGRIPVATVSEASNAVAKISSYLDNSEYGAWKNACALIADDNETGSAYNLFVSYAESAYKLINSYAPYVDVKKIYYDAYTRSAESTGARYPEVESLIQNLFDSGTKLINYIGHSSYTAWSAERTLTQSEANSFENSKLNFLFSASCEFSRFDSYVSSVGESLVLNPNGGSIGVIATARTVLSGENDAFDQKFLKNFYTMPQNSKIGDVIVAAKNAVQGASRRTFCLLGDPALDLQLAQDTILVDSMQIVENDGSVVMADTIGAMSHVRVFAHVSQAGSLKSSFNGVANISVYDKMQTLSTKGNNGKTATTYTDYTTTVFSGKADVTDGLLSFDMIVPKDISYTYGNGRMLFYAYDSENFSEAAGVYNDFVIGGSADDIIWENDGPEISMYLNTPYFKNGDKVNSSPVLFVSLNDESGINAAGAGIGHDIMLTLDDGSEPICLNSYFTYALGSCQNGSLSYKLNDLPDGKYTLTIKAWDLQNNSSSSSISFVVDSDKKPDLDNMVVYPNPVSDVAYVTVQTDIPQQRMEYRLFIYDMCGQTVNTICGNTVTDNGQLNLKWNLNNEGGARVQPGVYVCRLQVKSEMSNFEEKTKKIVVLPQ